MYFIKMFKKGILFHIEYISKSDFQVKEIYIEKKSFLLTN
jgi:hypothetical protein